MHSAVITAAGAAIVVEVVITMPCFRHSDAESTNI